MAKVYRIISDDRYNFLVDRLKIPEVQEGGGAVDFIQYLPVRVQSKARTLLNIISRNPRIKVDADGSIVINEQKVIGSHICDLLTFATQPGYTKKTTYPGLKQFKEIVQNSNVPTHLLTSNFLQQQDDTWIQKKLSGR